MAINSTTTKCIIAIGLILSLLFFAASALGASVTVDFFGTNTSNAQSNITKTGNNSYQVIQWAIGDTTKSLKADINGNASDSITFTLHNFTVGRVVEVKVNSSAYNSYQADATGAISFNRTQTVRNQTYSFSPAVNAGGYNFTWGWFKEWIWIGGQNLSSLITPAVRPIVNVTANYTIGNTTGTMFTCYANSGTLNLTLPVGVTGTEFTIKKKDATANTCSVFSSQNIDGANYANISTQYDSIDVVFTSDEWSII